LCLRLVTKNVEFQTNGGKKLGVTQGGEG